MESCCEWLNKLNTDTDVDEKLSEIMNVFGNKYSEVYAVDRETQKIYHLRHKHLSVDVDHIELQGKFYEDAMRSYIDETILVEDRKKLTVLKDFDFVCERLRRSARFGAHCREKIRGAIRHIYVEYTKIGGDEDFSVIIVAFVNEDADLQRSKEAQKEALQRINEKRTVLIVEDNEMNREILEGMLEDEYKVLQASDGEEGLRLLADHWDELSVVLLDVYMPVCTGFEFLSRVKDDRQLSSVPVIMMTGSDIYEDEVKCLEMGATDFVRKPYNANVIKSRIRSIIRLREISATLADVEIDEMTGVYTRSAFYHHAEAFIQKYKNTKHIHVIVADIRRFKLINTIYGDKMGDRVLVYLANSFREVFNSDVVARYGSDQFVAVFYGDPDFSEENINRMIMKIQNGAPVENLVVSYGIYRELDTSLTLALLCDRAFTAMKSVKKNSESKLAFYNDEMTRRQMEEQILENAFDEAIAGREFYVVYQPKYDAKTERIVGAEALIRWKRKDGTAIWPNQFIPLFEKNGMIQRLDEYVFRDVCRVQREHREKGDTLVPISVNLSRATIHTDATVETYLEIVKQNDIPFSSVPIELTESAALQSMEIKGLMEKMFEAGFSLHMDDFGTGYSSITSLNVLPFEVMKMDKSLADYIGSYRGEQILKNIISLGHGLNMKVLCEGVETREQADFLRDNGCDEIQGYFYSKPLVYEEFCETVKNSFEQ